MAGKGTMSFSPAKFCKRLKEIDRRFFYWKYGFFPIRSASPMLSGFYVERASYRFRLYVFADPLFVLREEIGLTFATPLSLGKSAFRDFKSDNELYSELMAVCRAEFAHAVSGLDPSLFLSRLENYPKRPLPSHTQWMLILMLAFSGRLDDASLELSELSKDEEFMAKKANFDSVKELNLVLQTGESEVNQFLEDRIQQRRRLLFGK